MAGRGVEPYAVHTVRALEAPRASDELRQAALDAAPGPYTVWGPDQWRDAVAVFPQFGALPAMLQDARVACEQLGFQ
eukprot:5061632-Lingulodinium_polyedra.AAC.1